MLVDWALGLSDWQDLNNTFKSNPVSIAVYAEKKGLLEEPGWKRCKRCTKQQKVIGRMINQVRLRNFRNAPRYKCGFQVPRKHQEDSLINEREGNSKWVDSERLEIQQLHECDTFKNLGKGGPTPDKHKKIPCHVVCDVKWDGRHKSRFVVGGHRTDAPIKSACSAVASPLGVHMVTFPSELNDLELWSTNIGNASLGSYTSEKVCFIAGPEFEELEGCTMVIIKEQCGLKSSGKCWHDRLHDVLRTLGFSPSKAEEDTWMRDSGDHC